MSNPSPISEITLTPIFKLVFVTVTGLTLLSLLISVSMSICINSPNGTQLELIQTCSGTWKMGFAAVLGLVGGKAT